jgi:hypothetical protein
VKKSPDLDYSERAGFLVGKAANLAEWQHRKEEREYAKLFERLKRRNHRKKPEVRERLNATRREYDKRPEVQEKNRKRRKVPAYVAMMREANHRYERKPEVRARRDAWARANREKINARRRKMRGARTKEQKERAAARDAAWKKANRDKVNAARRKREAAKKGHAK